MIFGIIAGIQVISYAQSPTEDIERTQLQDSNTYYSYDFETATLTIDGEGDTPDFTNTSGASTSQPWFFWRSDGSILNVVVEEGITSLGNYFFYNVNTAQISLPSTLKKIGNNAMSGTNANESIALPEGLTTILNNAFANSVGLKSVIIPSTVTTIGVSAFENCIALESVVFSDWNTSPIISRQAFFKCSSLKSMTIPKGAVLQSYSVGFYAKSSGSVYNDFVMNIYRDSPAYNYAVSKIVKYQLIDTSVITEGARVACEYFNDSMSSSMIFSFTPAVTADYEFFSDGDIDVMCSLEDNSGNKIAENNDASFSDSDFYICERLTAEKTYYFIVNSNMYIGVFNVYLMPKNAVSIDFSVKELTLSADEKSDGKYDIMQYINTSKLTAVFDTGYTNDFLFDDNSTYLKHNNMVYTDSQEENPWLCGEQNAYVNLGGLSSNIKVMINHLYIAEIIPPTLSEDGYTKHTCVGCGDAYFSDYVPRLGILVKGRAVLMENTDGSHPHNYTLTGITVTADGKQLYQTKDDGAFEFYIDSYVQNIIIGGSFAKERAIELIADENGVADLGDVAMINFDYNGDDYVNAKDFAYLNRIIFDHEPITQKEFSQLDYNHDLTINEDDWQDAGAVNFYTCGRVDESIYNNLP